MLLAERRSRLVELVNVSGVVSTEELAAQLSVSAETIRRDLLALEASGALSRVYGGAASRDARPEASTEASFDVRSEREAAEKQRIARSALRLIPPQSMIMIDVGSTALSLARALPPSLEATVVTNSLRVATELSNRSSIELFVVGGRTRSGDLAISGEPAIRFLEQFHFDVAFLGSGGLDAEAGLTDYYLDEVETRRVVIRRSARSYVLCDSTKFDRVARYRVAGFDELTGVVVDRAPEGALASALSAAGAEVHQTA